MAEFGDLPEIMTVAEFGLRELIYDQKRKMFSIGGEDHDVVSHDLYRNLLFPTGSQPPDEELPRKAVLLNDFGNPITTPRFFRWLTTGNRVGIFHETSDVMRDVFEKLQGEKLKGKLHERMDPFGFSCSFIREGHMTLSVLGNCACLGTNPDGHFVDWREWETGFAEYEFHNIDMPHQRISLLAGLGHLALICGSENL